MLTVLAMSVTVGAVAALELFRAEHDDAGAELGGRGRERALCVGGWLGEVEDHEMASHLASRAARATFEARRQVH